MDPASDSTTNPTLLGKLCGIQNQDTQWKDNWQRFMHKYRPKIEEWARYWGLQRADVDEITQEVWLKLLKGFKNFKYDPAQSFRGYLKTITKHVLVSFAKGQDKATLGSADSHIQDLLNNQTCREDLEKRLEKTYDMELLEVARESVRKRVVPHKWAIFEQLTTTSASVDIIAAKFNVKVAQVFQAKSDVKRMLKEELRRLDPPISGETGEGQ